MKALKRPLLLAVSLCLGIMSLVRADYILHPVRDEATQRLLRYLLEDADPADSVQALAGMGAVAAPEDIERIRGFLFDEQEALRAAALRAAAVAGLTVSESELERLAADDQPRVRRLLYQHLRALYPEPPPDLLERALDDPAPEVRAAVAAAVDDPAPLLPRLAAEPSDFVRQAWLRALLTGTGEARNEALEWAFASPGAIFRAEALAALGPGDEAFGERVVELLADKRPLVAEAAAVAVGALADVRLVPAVLDHLEAAGPVQRVLLCRALESFGAAAGEEAAKALARHMGLEQWSHVQRAAADGLLAMRTETAVAGLLEHTRSIQPYVRRLSAEMLGRLGRREHAGALLRYVEDPDHEAAYAGLLALRLLNAPGVLAYQETLREWITHEHAGMAAESIRLLGQLEDREALPAIRALLERIRYDQPHPPRVAAFEFLTALGDDSLLRRAVAIAARPVVIPPPGDSDLEYDHEEVRIAAMRYLGHFGDERAARALSGAWRYAPGPAMRRVLAETMEAMTGVRYRVLPSHRFISYPVESLGPPPVLHPEAPGIEPLE